MSARLPGPGWLFCPGDRPDRYAKAAAAADVVVLDLEDAVPPARKASARGSVAAAAGQVERERLVVRLNAVGTRWFAEDLEMARRLRPLAVMVPKANGRADVRAAGGLPVVALCESAAGVLGAREIAEEPGCLALLWGAEDFAADIGAWRSRDAAGRCLPVVEHARSAVLLAGAAAGRPVIDAVWTALDDHEGLAVEAAAAAAAGFTAKACIHPAHVPVVRDAFVPSPEEVAAASAVLRAARDGVVAHAGHMVDEPMLRRAAAVLRRAGFEHGR